MVACVVVVVVGFVVVVVIVVVGSVVVVLTMDCLLQSHVFATGCGVGGGVHVGIGFVTTRNSVFKTKSWASALCINMYGQLHQ